MPNIVSIVQITYTVTAIEITQIEEKIVHLKESKTQTSYWTALVPNVVKNDLLMFGRKRRLRAYTNVNTHTHTCLFLTMEKMVEPSRL